MTASLREAAQALLECFPDDPGGAWPEVTALRAALALPPEPGWAEGYRAGLEAAERLAKDWNAAGYPIGCAISQIPIPSAPAPEATAESEVGWICVRRQRRGNLYDNASGMFDAIEVYPQTEGARDARGSMQFPRDWDVTRVRLTVEPSPVEPEETQPDTHPTRRTP